MSETRDLAGRSTVPGGGAPGAADGSIARIRRLVADFSGRHRSGSVMAGMAITAVGLPLLVLLPPMSGFSNQSIWVNGFTIAGIYVLLALGLNIVVGLSGLLDLGYAAFFAIGSYTFAFAASPFTKMDIPFWPMLLVGALAAAFFGILLGAPTLRLRGDYLAIVTLGFGEIVPIMFLNSSQYTEGPNGIGGISPPSLPFVTFASGNPWPYYVTMIMLITLSMILVYRLQDSRLGRAWMAIREDELAAAANGVNTVTTKLLAFALGASTAGLAGVFASSKLTLVSPNLFRFDVSFTVLAMVVLGGMGNVWGVAIGAFIVFMIQSVILKQLNILFDNVSIPVIGDFLSRIDFLQYQFLLYGIALVAMMLLRPEGLFPNRRRRRELHAAEDEEFGEHGDAMGASPE
jgi:ABC-type branched-subunit amino acid transport system permease subunit